MDRQDAAPRRYFVSGPIDFFLVSGISLVTFTAMLAADYRELTPEVVTLAAFLLWIVNYPHFSMSSYRLYHSRENIRQYPVTALVIPVVVAFGAAASFAYPNVVAPMFVKLFIIWSPYHFSGQTVGVTMVYARRGGVAFGKMERLALSGFVFGTFVFSTLLAETSERGYDFLTIHYPGLGVPQWIVTGSEYGMWAAGAAFAYFVFDWSLKHKRLMPLMVLMPAITQYVWFVAAAYMPAYKQLVPMFHSLQYILIVWGIQLVEKMEAKKIEPSRGYVGMETARWYGINFLGGLALFWAIPQLAVTLGYSVGFATAVLVSAIQIHHFFVDGVIWKLRRRTNSQPLTMSLQDVTGGAQSSGVREAPA